MLSQQSIKPGQGDCYFSGNQNGDQLNNLQQKIENEFNQSILNFNQSEEKIQARILKGVRSELIAKTNELRMPQERRSYLLHQLVNCHSIEELVSLLREVNINQLKMTDVVAFDLVYLSGGKQSVTLVTQSFSTAQGTLV